MSNSETVEERVSRDYECVTCGWSEFDVRETTAVADGQDENLVGERYEECRNCGETYAGVGGRSDHLSREPDETEDAEQVLKDALGEELEVFDREENENGGVLK